MSKYQNKNYCRVFPEGRFNSAVSATGLVVNDDDVVGDYDNDDGFGVQQQISWHPESVDHLTRTNTCFHFLTQAMNISYTKL